MDLKGNFSALFVIVEVSSTPPWMCHIHTTTANIQTIPPPSYVESPFTPL